MKKILISIASVLCSVFIVLALCGIVGLTLKPNEANAAGEYNLIIEKTATITVYVTGKNVKHVSSTLAQDTYLVEDGSQVTLYAVNESKIFTSWSVSTLDNEITSNPCEFTVDEETTVTVNRRDPEGTDRGRYMYNKFTISEAEDLIAIQDIIAHGEIVNSTDTEIISYYDKFFSTYPGYEELTLDSEKATFITGNHFHTIIQNGYYFVEGNIALMDPEYVGIGTPQYPFRGVFCGNNDGNYSKIITTITTKEKTGNTYYGLFGILDAQAVIRNLKINTAVGIAAGDYASNDKAYIGGVAGYINHSLLYNVEVSTTMSTDVHSTHVHAGGIAGHYRGGFSELNKITYNGLDTSWGLTVSSNSDKHIYSGYIAGVAKAEKVTNPENANLPAITDTYNPEIYFKGITLDLSRSSANIHSESGTSATGNLLGYIKVDDDVEIENIVIKNEYDASVQSTIKNGNAYVGGLIGHVEATNSNYTLSVGRITFNSINCKHSLVAQTTDASSYANVISGGLFGKIDSVVTDGKGNVYANDEFKNGYYTEVIDGKEALIKKYIFNGNFSIKAIQNGKGDSSNLGKAISGGLSGKGLFDINGTDSNNPTNILISDNGRFEVDAVQSATSSTNNIRIKGDIEHCIASMTFGIIASDNSYNNYDLKNINIYANNAYVTATREVGSHGNGDVRASGFIGYIKEIDVNGLNLFVNKSKFSVESLSYEIQTADNVDDNNNAFCGGVFGQIEGRDHNYDSTTRTENVTLAGFDKNTLSQIGTTLKLNSIQNTQAGGHDTMGENYIGGIAGLVHQVDYFGNCNYYGSETHEDEIIMQGHQSPDSSFCGGLIGLIWSTGMAQTFTVINCEVNNATIKGYATTTKVYSNPDMYCGGAFGASYHKVGSTHNFTGVKVFNTEVFGIGNERIEVYAAGIVSGITWSGTQHFTDCYVYKSTIDASSSSLKNEHNKDDAYAAGIVAHNTGTTSHINYCAIIDSTINATSTYGKAYAGGLAVKYNYGFTFTGNYINSVVTAKGLDATEKYTFVAHETTYGYGSNNYYTDNLTSSLNEYSNTDQIKVEMGDLQLTKTASDFNLVDNYYTGNKFWPILSSGAKSQFDILYVGTPNNVLIRARVDTGVSDIVDLWVNVKNGGSQLNPTLPENYPTSEDAQRDGWFCLGSIIVYTTVQDGQLSSMKEIKTTYVDTDGQRYVFDADSSTQDGDRFLMNEEHNEYKIQSGFFEPTVTNATLNDFTIVNEYDIKLYDEMPYMEITFKVTTKSIYHLNLLNESGNSPSQTELHRYGTFQITNSENYGTITYKILYHPNREPDTLTPFTFYATFMIGSGTAYESKAFRFVITPNVKTLAGVELANYTPGLNYTEEGLGQTGNPYVFRQGQTVKFIPVFRKSNDFTNKLNNSDTNTEYVIYTLNGSAGTMKSSGELVISSTHSFTNGQTEEYSVTVTVKDGVGVVSSQTIYFVVAENDYTVSFSVKGTDVQGLTYTSSITDYHFTINKYSNYSGVPKIFTITIGGTKYDLVASVADRNQFKLANDKDIEFDDALSVYDIVIPHSLINGNIVIDIQMVVIYEVTLVLNNQSFFPHYNGDKERTFYISSGQTLYQHFYETGKTQVIDGETQSMELLDIKSWISSGGTYGYTFNGFYLVEDASSLNSYGKRFEEIANDINNKMQISTNITFYGSWSFLVELIEAPGTKIKSSFPEAFMKSYKTDLVNNTIEIPINNNRGYVFTIEKDPNFYGEASVKAFSVTQIDGENKIDEIRVEKYHDNMYLYFISPEDIHGYLVVQTSATNSELIVGENTAKVSDEVIPADGIYTFKYATNHTNINGEKSYIYNYLTKNGSLKKEFTIEFFRQRYNPEMKFARFTSSDGKLYLDVRNGELGHTYNANIPTYFINFHDTNEFKTTIGSNEITNGIKEVKLLFDMGHVTDEVLAGMKVYGNTNLTRDGWVEISGTKGMMVNYDTIDYSFDTSENYKYFYITNETGVDQHIHKFRVTDSTDYIMGIDLDSPVVPGDVDGKLDRTYTFFDGFELTPRTLKVGTIIEVFYYKYVNGEMTETVIGNYEVVDEDIQKINLSEFKLLDGVTKAFDSNQTFSSFLSNTEGTISEVYYFSITPTNGTDFDEIDETNYVVYSGYVDENGDYIEGDKTSDLDIDNIPLEEDFGQLISMETSLQEKMYTVTHSRDTYLKYDSNNGDPYYTFTDIDDYDVYKFDVTGLENPNGIEGFIPLVNEIGYDTVITSELLQFYIGEIKLKTFSHADGVINVYGSVDGVKWSTPMPIEVKGLVEKEYVLDVSLYDFVMFKIDSISSDEIELRSLTINDKVTKVDFEIDFSESQTYEINGDTVTYTVRKDIVGDNRHDGKKFVLALQLIDGTGNVVSSLPGDIYIRSEDKVILPNNSGATGLNVMYFNLSSLINENVEEYNFVFENLPSGYKVVVQLLEVTNAQKPAMGEVRCQIIDGVHTPFKKGDYSDHDH